MDPWLDFLSRQGARLDQGRVAAFATDPHGQPGLTPVTDRGVLQVQGPDSDKLLQGQLTCDLSALQPGETVPGALCDIKGRMFSSFLVHRIDGEQVLLVMHGGLVETTRATLAKFAPFYKVELADTSDDWRYLGVSHTTGDPCALVAARSDQDAAQHCLRMADELALVLTPESRAETLWSNLADALTPLGEPGWEQRLIAAGLGEVRPATSGSFLPQMLNLQITGGVSFRKGCYTGQEVVARMHYRGKLKRRMYRLSLEGAQSAPAAGTGIQDDSGRDAGTVVMAAAAGDRTEMLAVLTTAAASAEQLDIGGQTVAVNARPLPYADQLEPADA